MLSSPPLPGSLRLLLDSGAVTPATARALLQRFQQGAAEPRFFSPAEYALLSTVCDVLMDQTPESRLLDVSWFIDERLAEGKSEGWRFDHMPSSPDMYQRGLPGIDETADLMFDKAFIQLERAEQAAVLKSLQEGTASGSVWQKMSAATFFEELLAEATEIFYAHPSAQEEIAYTGMADAFGWTKIGLNETDDLTRMNLDDEDLPE